MKRLLIIPLFLILSAKALSQNTRIKDSTIVSNKALDLIIKDLKKFDSLQKAYKKKDDLIQSMVESNLDMFNEFITERDEKNAALNERKKIEKELRDFEKKRFSFGVSIGPALVSDFKIEPAVMIGINFTIFRF